MMVFIEDGEAVVSSTSSQCPIMVNEGAPEGESGMDAYCA